MFTVHTNNDETLENVTFPELVRLSDEGEIFQLGVSNQSEVISIELPFKSNHDWHKVHLVISKGALNKLKEGRYGDRYEGTFISDEELEAAYCYKYEGNYDKGTWYLESQYPVLDLDLKRRVEEDFFCVTSRTPLSDEDIESLKQEVEGLHKYQVEGAEKLISSLTLEQKQALKQFYGLDLLDTDSNNCTEEDDDYDYDD